MEVVDYASRAAYPMRPPSDLRVCEIERCIQAGMTSYEAASELGVRRHGLMRQCYRLGIRWPYDPATKHRAVWAYGRWWSFAEIARCVGTRREVIRRRWCRGVMGDDLFKEVRRYDGGSWDLGISLADWYVITAHAERAGVSEAARKYGVPGGAVQAAMLGEWERLG